MFEKLSKKCVFPKIFVVFLHVGLLLPSRITLCQEFVQIGLLLVFCGKLSHWPKLASRLAAKKCNVCKCLHLEVGRHDTTWQSLHMSLLPISM